MASSVKWNFLTNHSYVLIALAQDAEQPLRAVAMSIGITERAVQRIVAELEAENYLSHTRRGRQNVYVLHPEVLLRHGLDRHCSLDDLLDVIVPHRPDNSMLGDWMVGEHGSEVR